MQLREQRAICHRLAIWQQILHAIAERPWFGYGWHQTSVAYTLISDQFQGPVWVKSAHNFILDFIVWNGLVIAIPFFAYLSYWAINCKACDIARICDWTSDGRRFIDSRYARISIVLRLFLTATRIDSRHYSISAKSRKRGLYRALPCRSHLLSVWSWSH